MAKRSKRSRKSTLGAARAALGDYVESGSKQVNDTVTSFLSMFDTGQLIAALKRQAQAAGRGVGMKSAGRRGRKRRAGRPKMARTTTATRGKTRKTTGRRKARRSAR